MHTKSLQSCPTLCNPVDPGEDQAPLSGILPSRILEWDAMPSSRRSSNQKIKSASLLCLLHWQASSSSLVPSGKPLETNSLDGQYSSEEKSLVHGLNSWGDQRRISTLSRSHSCPCPPSEQDQRRLRKPIYHI